MRKKIVLLSIIIVVMVVITVVIIDEQHKKDADEEAGVLKDVVVYNWNGLNKEYIIAHTTGKTGHDSTYCKSYMSVDKSLDELKGENDDCIGEFTYHCDCTEYEGLMFYDDNNYYCIYKTEYEKNYYSIRNMYSKVTIHNKTYVPTIMELDISEGIIKIYREKFDEDYTDIFFDYYTYDEIKEFYMRMSEDYYDIDEENKKISVRGYDVRNNVYVDNCLTFDFNSKTITGLDSDGTAVNFN